MKTNLDSFLEGKSIEELRKMAQAVIALKNKYKYNKAQFYFPEEGRLARRNYPVQMDLMRAGKKHHIRALVGGNSTGKSLWNALETYYHLSGKYPAWWEGLKFNRPISAMMASIDGDQLRDGIQKILFGGTEEEDIGSGVIAREDMLDDNGQLKKWEKAGTVKCITMVKVRHCTNGVFDGWSDLEFKTYLQGWASFQGSTLDWASFDEEPEDRKVLAEALRGLRPKDGGEMGHFLISFTPTHGYTDTYLNFVPDGIPPIEGIHPNNPDKYTAMIGWSLENNHNSPHLTEQYKRTMLQEWAISDPHNIQARTQGLAAMGAGRVYPIEESRYLTSRQIIPSFCKKAFGLDPGQANFACLWAYQDPNTNVITIYDEYKTTQHILYLIHAEAIKARGAWISGGIDPHEAVKPRDTGETVQSYFESLGLKLVSAEGDPDALRIRIRAMLESGALKISEQCVMLRREILSFHYDAKDPNKIARGQDDHLCSAMMYLICVFESIAQSYFQSEEELYQAKHAEDDIDNTNVNKYTGY